MTVVVYRDGIMAGDTCVGEGGMSVATVDKVARSPKGWLAGAAGDVKDTVKFLEWARKDFKSRAMPATEPSDNFSGLAISPDGAAHFYEGSWTPFSVGGPYHAIGSGAHAALIAMDMGASSVAAAKAVCRRVFGCAEPITTVRL